MRHRSCNTAPPTLLEVLPYVDAMARSTGQSLDYTLFVLLVRRMANQGTKSADDLIAELQNQFRLHETRRGAGAGDTDEAKPDAARAESARPEGSQHHYDRRGRAFSF